MSQSLNLDRQKLSAELGEDVADLVIRFAHPVSASELKGMAFDVDKYLAVLRRMSRMASGLDLELGRRIGRACKEMIRTCDTTEQRQVALVVAAIRYFVYPYDAEDDVSSQSGLEDDAMVVNYVIRETGLPVEPVEIPAAPQ
jgi:hypothetical protein